MENKPITWTMPTPLKVAQPKAKTLIIGAGEIGKSLGEVLLSAYEVVYGDVDSIATGEFDVIHICFPYSKNFVSNVENYISVYRPKLTIIHSTVKIGTTRQLGNGVVHSPVNGRHPDLAKAIKTFIKFIGSIDTFAAFQAVDFLNKAGIKTQVFSSPETTELAKILCTTRYGWAIMEMKETERLCREHGVPFHEVYTDWNNNYNNSYAELQEYRFMRPTLFPLSGAIGGHCVIPNCELLPGDFLTETLKGRNQSYVKISEPPTAGVGLPTTENSSLKGEKHAYRKRNKDLASRTLKHPRSY